jgi:hypothetical protein
MKATALALALALVALVACGSDSPKLSAAKLEDPATCMECHGKHYTEWAGSMHAYASDDPVFVAMNKRGQRETNNQLGTFCVQCHAPMAVALNLTDGTDYDPTTLPPTARGVTCYFCHDVKSIADDHNNGLVLALDSTMRGGVHDPTDSPAHNSKYDAQMDSYTNNSVMCGSCHDVTTPKGAKLERTYAEWQTTIFTTSDVQAGTFEETCSGCHMATDGTSVIVDGMVSNIKSRPNSFHKHYFPGIDQALTPWPGTDDQTGAIHFDLDPALTIVGPTPLGQLIGEGGICLTPINGGQITVRMDTRGVGHMWPSGAAQDRRAWLEVIAYDASNNVLFSSGAAADNQDPEALSDPNLFGLWDRIYKDDAMTMPAHFFWEVSANGIQSKLLRPPITLVKTDAAFDHSSTATFPISSSVYTKIDHISARVRIRPLSYAVLDDLVSTGDLDAGIASQLKTLDIPGADRHWIKAHVDLASGCDSNPYE